MKIRAQIILTMLFFALLLVIIGACLFITNRQVNQLSQQENLAHNIDQAASVLGYLANDYLLYQQPQQRTQWEAGFASLSADVARLNPSTAEQQSLVKTLQADQASLQAAFSAAENGSTDAPAEARLAYIQDAWSRIEVQSQDMIIKASLLAEVFEKQVEQSKQFSSLLILSLIASFVAYFLVNYSIISRRILRSLSDLETGTRIVGSGNLDYSIPDHHVAEIDSFGQAFNRMTANLREVTATKADLEREIAERKKAEMAAADYARRLEQSNKELENFAILASHDLKEPLRKIETFGKRIKENASPVLGPIELDYLERMQNAARRMSSMVDGLLSLSKVTTGGSPFVQVDLNQVARAVLDDLDTRIGQTGAQVELCDLPVIQADPVQIQQVLQNLIANALKFQPAKPDVPPHVIVQSRPLPDHMLEITVKDNGIGFDMEHARVLFQPFQRLHGRSQFEGIGMGLSICRKIIERHGGSITARSQPGEGATMTIVLPAS